MVPACIIPEKCQLLHRTKLFLRGDFKLNWKNSKDCIEKPCRRFRFWCIYQLTECSRGVWKAHGGSSCSAKKLGRDCSWLLYWHRNSVPGRRGSVKRTQRWKFSKGKGRAVRIDSICPDKGPADIYVYIHLYTHIYMYVHMQRKLLWSHLPNTVVVLD